jgi:Uma2 family endonuclease
MPPLPFITRVPSGPPRNLLWTVDQFHALGDLGCFEGRRAWLINGVIIEEGPMNPPHRIALELTDNAMRVAFGVGWRVCVQMPRDLGHTTDPEPDIAVVPGNPRVSASHPTTAALVIEVADTSLKHDITSKAEAYATGGIADYWVLDVDGRRLLVFRDPVALPAGLGATAYRTQLTLGLTDSIAPLAAPTSPVRVADLLP